MMMKKVIKMQLLKLCRSCIKEVASWELENFDDNVVSMFTFCTNVEISEDDKLPKQFCYDCTIKIESSYTFIKRAQEVNATLENLISRVETSVIVKSENFVNNLPFNESNPLQSDLDNSEDKVIKNNETIFTSDSSQNCEYKIGQDIYPCAAPLANEINESLVKKDIEFTDTTLNSNTDEFDADKEEICNGDYSIQIDTTDEINETEKYKKSREVTGVNETTKKNYNTRSKIQHPYEIKIKEKANEKQTENEDTRSKCHICQMVFTFKARLLKHIRSKHSKEIKEKDRVKNKPQEEKGENTKLGLKTCDICERTFTSALWFSRHIEKEHSNSVKHYSCPHCTETFPSYSSWRYHKDKHEESRRFACETCGARFRLGKQLAAHAKTHGDARPHVCTKCGMAFKIKSILTNHMKLHLADKPFLCSVCGFSTKRRYTLKDHMVTHTGEKPYACKKCPFRSSSSANLGRHELRHRGEKPHVCQHCGKRFYEPGTLSRHVRIHTGERPFQCYMCTQTFSDTWKCKTHIMRHHRIPLEDIPRLSKVKTTSNEPMKTTSNEPMKTTSNETMKTTSNEPMKTTSNNPVKTTIKKKN